jgi:hypothetical protein
MYIRKEIMKNSLGDREKIKIGPDAVLFKYIEDAFEDHSLSIVEGKVWNVGLDFVEILQKDHSIVTVKTDRITHVKWPDKKTRELVLDCKYQGHCRCVEFDCLRNANVGKRKRPQRVENIRENSCLNCHKTPCKCQKKDERRNKDDRMSSKKFMKTERFEHVHCEHCGKYHDGMDNQCPNCHEDHRRHKHVPCGCNGHFERRRYSQYSHDMRNHDCCHKNFTCFCDHAIPFCDNRFELRLAGLNDDIKFKFLQHKGCHVEIILG